MKLLVALLAVALAFAAPVQDKAAAIDALMSCHHDYGYFNGSVLVAERGHVIYQKGFGLANMEWEIPNTPDTKFRLGSITKQFTAALVLQLVEQDKIDLKAPMTTYLPDYPKKTGDKVNIHHLLTHTSGIPSYTGLPDFVEKRSRDPYTPAELIKVFSDMELEFEPGSKFRYNNSGYFLLGAIIEKVTGQSYEDVLRKRIFEPLGMRDSGYDHHRTRLAKRAGAYEATLDGYQNAGYLDMSIPYAAGSLYSTVEDLHKWDQALYTDKVVSAKSRELMFTPVLENYAYGWTVRKAPSGAKIIGHGGGINGFSTLIERLVEDRHLIVLLNNTGGTRLGEMAEGIRAILAGQEAKMPKRPVAPALYQAYKEKGAAAAIAQYRELKAKQSADYDLGPGELGRLAQHLRRTKKIKDAIEVHKLNTEENPKNSFAWYGLAEAYREDGNREQAARAYVKAMDLHPDPLSTPAVDRLKELSRKQ